MRQLRRQRAVRVSEAGAGPDLSEGRAERVHPLRTAHHRRARDQIRAAGQRPQGVRRSLQVDHRVRRDVFVTGGTGYLGRPLIETLLGRGHTVRALTRPESTARRPAGVTGVVGNALDPSGWVHEVAPADTVVHLIGTPHPSAAKAAQFRRVDLVSIEAAVQAATTAGVRHFVYVSGAHPAPVMKAFVEVRKRGEEMVSHSGLSATILRAWYVLGPGHWWPLVLMPLYVVARVVPSTRTGARRLALVPRAAVVDTMVRAVEGPPDGVRVIEAPDMRRG